jgi:hypothetical protein
MQQVELQLYYVAPREPSGAPAGTVRDTELVMKPKEPPDPSAKPPDTGPLANLVEDELNKSTAEQLAEELEEREERDQPKRSGATDYARGTAEHEDDRET